MKRLNAHTWLLAVALGLAGCAGDDGKDGRDGDSGNDGHPGEPGAPGAPGNDGQSGQNGQDGQDGQDGSDAPATAINEWFLGGQAVVDDNATYTPNTNTAKNVIVFVGDGMGVTTVTASRIYDGQLRGEPGEENSLMFERWPHVAMSKTYNTNAQIPDSAGTMTAIMTGVKTDMGVIGVGEAVERGNCDSVAGNELLSALSLAELGGKSTGIVSTARITHATPAATYSISPDRNYEDDTGSGVPGCGDIARQLVEFPHGDGLEVALGGGRRHFLPNTTEDHEDPGQFGRRADGVDLTQQWLANYPNAAYVFNRADFVAVDPASTDHLLGLFERSHMEYEADRASDAGGEPSIAEMTAKSIDILSKNDAGFFLMVEGGRIDHAHHAGNAARALEDTLAFSDAIRVALEKVDLSETLIIVTADHSHVFTIAGYPTRGNPILGTVRGNDASGAPSGLQEVDATGRAFTTLGYTNGPGFGVMNGPVSFQQHRVDLTYFDTHDIDFRQEARVPLSSETHSGEDVAIYAIGPWSHLLSGTVEQNYIFHVINHAARLVERADTSGLL